MAPVNTKAAGVVAYPELFSPPFVRLMPATSRHRPAAPIVFPIISRDLTAENSLGQTAASTFGRVNFCDRRTPAEDTRVRERTARGKIFRRRSILRQTLVSILIPNLIVDRSRRDRGLTYFIDSITADRTAYVDARPSISTTRYFPSGV